MHCVFPLACFLDRARQRQTTRRPQYGLEGRLRHGAWRANFRTPIHAACGHETLSLYSSTKSIFLMSTNYLTSREAARILGVSVHTIQQWTEKELLQSWKTEGGHRRISHDSVEKLLRKQQNERGAIHESQSLSILVIEDNAALRRLYLAHFMKWPFVSQVFTAPDGFDGLVLLGEVRPDLLICDLRLPGVTGFQIVRSVQNMRNLGHLQTVVVSGLPLPEINAHGGLPERVHVMGKPINFEELKSIALACLANKRAR